MKEDNENLEITLDIIHYWQLSNALKLLRQVVEDYKARDIRISKDLIKRIKREYGYCDMSFLKGLKTA